MKIIKKFLKVIFRIIKFIVMFPILCMLPKYKYDTDKLIEETEEIIKE